MKHKMAVRPTYRLGGVSVPEALVKDWRRRQQQSLHGSNTNGAGLARSPPLVPPEESKNGDAGGSRGQGEGVGARAEGSTAVGAASSGGRVSTQNISSCSSLASRLRQIKRMVPEDERGLWLLNNLLSQYPNVEEGEEICRYVQEKLRERTEGLNRMKDRRKLECDRRCVFSKAANEIRTASELMAESNRFNTLAAIVNDHPAAKLRRRWPRQHEVRHNPAATKPPPPPLSQVDGDVRISLQKHHHRAPTVTRPNSKKRARDASVMARDPSPPPSTRSVGSRPTFPSMHERISESGRINHHLEPTHKNMRRALVRTGEETALSTSSTTAWALAHGHASPGHLSLPSLDKRYGVGVVDCWMPSPVALRLGRPRPDSVAVMGLDRKAFRAHAEDVLRWAARQEDDRQIEIFESKTAGSHQSIDVGKRKNKQRNATSTGKEVHFSDPGRISESGRNIGLDVDAVPNDDVTGQSLSSHQTVTSSDRSMYGPSSAVSDISILSLKGDGIIRENTVTRYKSERLLRTLAELFPPAWSNTEGDSCSVTCASRSVSGRSSSKGRSLAGPATVRGRSGVGSLAAAAELKFRSNDARKVFKQTQRLLEAMRTPAKSTFVSCLNTGATEASSHKNGQRLIGAGAVSGATVAVMHRHSFYRGQAKRGQRGKGGGSVGPRGNAVGAHGLNRWSDDIDRASGSVWRDARKHGDKVGRLAEVFRCVGPPHAIRIECEILLHETGVRAQSSSSSSSGSPAGTMKAGGRGGHAGARVIATSVGDVGPGTAWDDLVHAWEFLGDGILAGRALAACLKFAEREDDPVSTAARSEPAADDLLSPGLMRALLFTRCYRPPGPQHTYVELKKVLEQIPSSLRPAFRPVSKTDKLERLNLIYLRNFLTAQRGWGEHIKMQ